MIAIGLLALGYASITATLADVIVRIDPASAHRLAPNDGRATAAFAEQQFNANLSYRQSSVPARLARRALLHDPTAVKALNVLGLQAQLRSDDASADRLFGYSVALSRRELQPQIWAIEKAVERGDIRQALASYDIALRTSRSAREVLFPILASAISERRIRGDLIGILASRAVWGQAFLRYASVHSPDPLAVAQLFRVAAAKGLSIEDADRAHVVNGLAAHGLMNEAWSFYETFRPGVDRTSSRDPEFDLGIQTPSLFDWTIGRAAGLSATIVPREEGGFLDFATPASARAVVASQTQLLPPGVYRLEGRSKGIDQPERSLPYWTLTCRAGPELGRVEVSNSGDTSRTFSGEFTVPQGCPFQTLSLVARASDNVSGVSGQIGYVRLARVKQ